MGLMETDGRGRHVSCTRKCNKKNKTFASDWIQTQDLRLLDKERTSRAADWIRWITGTSSTWTCTEARSLSKADIQVEHQFDEGGREGSWLGPRSLHLDTLSLKTLGFKQDDDREAPASRTCGGIRWSTPMEHLRKGGRPQRGQGGWRDYQEREAVLRKPGKTEWRRNRPRMLLVWEGNRWRCRQLESFQSDSLQQEDEGDKAELLECLAWRRVD
jgi:hypothetical protein